MAEQFGQISDFLQALRQQGIAVGPREIDRLRHLFAQQPSLERESLKKLLQAVVLKDPDQSDIFDALFDVWCPDRDADWRAAPAAPQRKNKAIAAPADIAPPKTTPDPPWWHNKRLQQWILAVLILLCPRLFPPEPIIEPQPPTIEPSASKPSEISDTLPDIPVQEFWSWRAEIDPAAVTLPARLNPLGLTVLALLALILVAFLLWRHRQRFPVLKSVQKPQYGPTWQPLPAVSTTPLIAPATRRRVLWHIEHYISEELTRRLDISRTVGATAQAAGFVKLHFEDAVYERGVQFWLDRQLQAPTALDAVDELSATLQAGGITVSRGYFIDVPHRIDIDHQRNIRPLHEEGAGRESIIAILCDGDGLARQLEHPLHKLRADRLLRSLRHWPRLCFVDCSADGRHLRALFEQHRYPLEVITRDELPNWLGGRDSRISTLWQSQFSGDEAMWAAALALGGSTVRSDHAEALRIALDLRVSPWRRERVLAAAADVKHRPALINRFLRSEPLAKNLKLRPNTLAFRTLSWWIQRYEEADAKKLKQQNPVLPWQESGPQQRWHLEIELLRLFSEPELATQKLDKLACADAQLKEEIRARLQGFIAADDPRPESTAAERIRLTWHFSKLPIETRHQLQQLGFDIRSKYRPGPLPPPLALCAGVFIGLALAALNIAVWYMVWPPQPQLLSEPPFDNPVLAAQTLRIIEPLDTSGRFRLLTGSARELAPALDVAAGAQAKVNWRWQPQANEYAFVDSNARTDTRVLRAGTLAQPIRACGDNWPTRSLVVIAASYEDQPARQLAIRLLDLGSADQVLIGTDWTQHLADWLGPSLELNQQTQLLVVLPADANARQAQVVLRAHNDSAWAIASVADFAALARTLTYRNPNTAKDSPFDERLLGVHAINTVPLPWILEPANRIVYFYGGPSRRKDDKGIEWVTICPGTVTIGDMEGDHFTAVLPGYEISATEVSQEQYVKLLPTRALPPEKLDLPMVDINWNEAQKACQAAGGDLPTEAQWEYAARGGSRTGWSFGDDDSVIGDYAWYEGNSGIQIQPVGQKAPNPMGLYDIHGNAWEWTRDRYGDYSAATDAPLINPEGASSGGLLIVRGGSFFDSSERLRSARRFGDLPGLRSIVRGFRCVRVPPQLLNH